MGQRGEDAACAWLEARGYRVVMRNWRCAEGEIDIVARQGVWWVLVEVRARRGTSEAALESVGPNKRRQLQKAAYLFIDQFGLHAESWRIDVIGVGVGRAGALEIAHVEDALGW